MNRFSEFYYTESLNEDLPILRQFANLFRQKKKVGIRPNWLSVLTSIDKTMYLSLLKQLADIFIKKQKIGNDGNTIVDIKAGDIQGISSKTLSKIGDFATDKQTKKDYPYHVPVYEMSNGGKFILFDLPKQDAANDSDRIYAFGMDGKGNKVFEQMYGMTFIDYLLTSDKPELLIKKPDEIKKYPKIIKPEEKSPPEEKQYDKMGVIDISDLTYEQLVNDWGTGRGFTLDKKPIPRLQWKGQYRRIPYANDISSGYKYDFGNDTVVFLLKYFDGNKSEIIFSNVGAYKKINLLKMIDIWVGNPPKDLTSKIPRWISPEEIKL